MTVDTAALDKANGSVAALISAATGKESATSLSAMLKTLAAEAGASGCVIWESLPPASFQAPPCEERLVAVAQWFAGGQLCHSKLPLRSTVGETILSQKSIYVEDVATDARLFIDAEFLECANVRSVFSVPVNPSDKEQWAISFFSTHAAPLNAEAMSRIEGMVSIVPILCQVTRDNVHFNLLKKLEITLSRSEIRKASRAPLNRRVRRDVSLLCGELANTFSCAEASIFLKGSSNGPGVLQLVGTTWQEQLTKGSYGKGLDAGAGGCLPARATPVHVIDLSHPFVDWEELGDEYLGFNSKGAHRGEDDDGGPKTNGNQDLQPLSLMAVPIIANGEVLGRIRCLTVKKDGRHFAPYDLELLQYVAARISHYWFSWLKQCEAYEEYLSWGSLLQSFNELDEFALDLVAPEETGAESSICSKALALAASALAGADILDVRLVDEEGRKLYFLAVHGEAWPQRTIAELNSREESTFRLDESEAMSARAYAIKKGRARLMTGSSVERYYSENFPAAKQMITAPIFLRGKCYGLLDICRTGERPFPEYATAVAEVICRRLASYICLAQTVNEMSRSQRDLVNLKVIHSQFHDDLAHQLKSPIFQAQSRIQKVLKRETLDNKLRSKLQAVRGLCNKASKVTMSTRLFATLARGETFQPDLSNLLYDDLRKMLIESAADSELMADPNHPIAFRVDRESLASLPTGKVLARVDYDLLQQALDNLLDNAGKYSYKNTVVRIAASFDADRRFFISVTNEGLPILADEVPKCVDRHWRGKKAKLTTGEGSGIGLWIVHHIMAAHGGKLKIIPTTSENVTEVRLIFP
ncbi:MAG: GAF domain-containing protein [Acidobacteriota bacterium]|nr:GAF domain-containing protein [Acidobacteriota bacterium]